jgi:hypothetical protein
MIDPTLRNVSALRRLRRALLLRRLRRLDPVLRFELTLIGVLGAAGIAWQARLPLDRLARAHGAVTVVAALAAALTACAVLGGIIAGADLLRRLRRSPAGPEWLALPVPPQVIAEQSAWESRLHALWVSPVALGLLVAPTGLVPWWAPALLAPAFLLLLLVSSRAAGALATGLALWRLRAAPARPTGARALEWLFVTTPTTHAAGRAPARWRGGAARAFLLKDLARTLRHTPARPRAVAWLVLLVIATALWALPLEPAAAATFSTVLFLAAAATLADWMIALSSGDPYPLLAALPLRAHRVWALRAAVVLGAAAVTALLLALAARPLGTGARVQLAAALAFATLLIGTLGVTYGVTLFPRVETAQRLVLLWLALALAASAMFALAGWVVLLGALAHALRRLRGRVTLAADVAAGEV